MKKDKNLFTTRDIATIGVMLALLEAVKQALVFIPNVELVSLLVILFSLHFGRRTIIATTAFTLMEIMIWGLHLWVIMYLYTWPILIMATLKLGRDESGGKDNIRFAILSGIFGLLFGALCSPVYIPISGIKGAITWWIAGIPMDIVHGISNFVLCLVLFSPLDRVITSMQRYSQSK